MIIVDLQQQAGEQVGKKKEPQINTLMSLQPRFSGKWKTHKCLPCVILEKKTFLC